MTKMTFALHLVLLTAVAMFACDQSMAQEPGDPGHSDGTDIVAEVRILFMATCGQHDS